MDIIEILDFVTGKEKLEALKGLGYMYKYGNPDNLVSHIKDHFESDRKNRIKLYFNLDEKSKEFYITARFFKYVL